MYNLLLKCLLQIGVENGNWGWGAAMLDFNNDKYTDLVMTNGIIDINQFNFICLLLLHLCW